MFQQLSFDVVRQVEAQREGLLLLVVVVVEQLGTKSKNLLCGSGCVGCGKVAGMFVASLFSPF